MPSPFWISAGMAALTAGLLFQVLVFRMMHEDPVAVYRLFSVRDKLIRLVIQGKIARNEAHFAAIYTELNALLRSSRSISGPRGWPIAAAQGKYLANCPDGNERPMRVSVEDLPEALRPLASELR